MSVGTRIETSYAKLIKIQAVPVSFIEPAQAIYAGRRDAVLDLRLLDGSIATGLRIGKMQTPMPVEFTEILAVTPDPGQVELWVLSTPEAVRAIPYV